MHGSYKFSSILCMEYLRVLLCQLSVKTLIVCVDALCPSQHLFSNVSFFELNQYLAEDRSVLLKDTTQSLQ